MLADCARLIGETGGFVLLSAHTPAFGPDGLAEALTDALPTQAAIERGSLNLTARTGRVLELGAFARWPGAR